MGQRAEIRFNALTIQRFNATKRSAVRGQRAPGGEQRARLFFPQFEIRNSKFEIADEIRPYFCIKIGRAQITVYPADS
jgi:hypothetical protein